MKIGEIWNFVNLFNEIFTFDIEWDFSRNWNWCLLQNRPLQYRLLQCRPQVKYPVGIDMESLRVVSSSEVSWYPFKNSIGSIFSDWIFLYFLPKVAWGFLQVWLTFLPSLCLCSRCARPCWFWFSWLQKMATECFFGSHSNFLCRLGHVMNAVGSCNEWCTVLF